MRHDTTGAVQLSPREQQIARGVLEGSTNKAIGYALQISEGTVANFVQRMFRELRVSNRTELARWALQNPGATRGQLCRPGLHPSDCACGSPYCAEMSRDHLSLAG